MTAFANTGRSDSRNLTEMNGSYRPEADKKNPAEAGSLGLFGEAFC